MILIVLKIEQKKSKFGKDFYYVFLKSDAGKSFRTCAYPAYGNFRRCGWDKVIASGVGTELEYKTLPINAKGLLDADIAFAILPKEPPRTELEEAIADNNLAQETIINRKAYEKNGHFAFLP